VLVNMPKLLREIVRDTLVHDPLCQIVSEYDQHVPLEVALDSQRADVVVVSADVFTSQEIQSRLLAEAPQLKVLAVLPDASQTVLHELHAHQVALGELSPERLVANVRCTRTGALP
jgi:DNA-binding NarL/FixJ family response regulator